MAQVQAFRLAKVRCHTSGRSLVLVRCSRKTRAPNKELLKLRSSNSSYLAQLPCRLREIVSSKVVPDSLSKGRPKGRLG